MNAPVIEIENLSFAYNGQEVLNQVDLKILQGDFMAMIGPNGGGKTTLIKLMLGLLKPREGSLKVLGKKAGLASHRIGYVPQNTNINIEFPISALDVVLMGQLQPRGRRRRHTPRDQAIAHEALNRMDMGAYCNRRMGELSGGQRQRVFIARALVSEPEILLLDEPTAHLDTQGQSGLYKLLSELNRDITIIVVGHDLLVLSAHVKSVACVNGQLHYHPRNDLHDRGMGSICPCTSDARCPVEIVSHGVHHDFCMTCKGS